MAILESMGRLGATAVDMVQTRLELAAIEIEEESQRLLGYLLLSLLALFLLGIGLLLVALLVVIVFWDTYRVAAASTMALLFLAGAGFIAMKVKAGFESKPRLLSHTIAELGKDINYIRNASAAHD
jgi:uncharacterized membrane protein YqjE